MFVQVLSTGEVWKLALCLYDLSANLSTPIERAQRQPCFEGQQVRYGNFKSSESIGRGPFILRSQN